MPQFPRLPTVPGGPRPYIRAAASEAQAGKIIIPALGQFQLDKLTTGDIQGFYTDLKKNGRLLRTELYGEGLSDQTVRGIHTTLHAALDRAVEEKLLFRNPADNCKLPSAKAREMQVLTPEEIQRLLIQAKEENYYELFLLELATGLRLGEIAALQWNDLNLTTGELRINKQAGTSGPDVVICEPKTKAAVRTLILPPSVLKVMREYRARVDSRWMFPSPKKEDSPMRPSSIHLRLHRILDHAGCNRVRFHDLRHTFATTALAYGMDIKTLSTILGHVSCATTLNTYSHVTDEMRQRAAVKIDRGIAKAEIKSQEEKPKERTMTTFQARKRWSRKAS